MFPGMTQKEWRKGRHEEIDEGYKLVSCEHCQGKGLIPLGLPMDVTCVRCDGKGTIQVER